MASNDGLVKLNVLGIVKTGSPKQPMTNYEGEVISRFKQMPTVLFADENDRFIAYQSNEYLGNRLKKMAQKEDYFPEIFKTFKSFIEEMSIEVEKFKIEFSEEKGFISSSYVYKDSEKVRFDVLIEEAIALSIIKKIPIYTNEKTMKEISYKAREDEKDLLPY